MKIDELTPERMLRLINDVCLINKISIERHEIEIESDAEYVLTDKILNKKYTVKESYLLLLYNDLPRSLIDFTLEIGFAIKKEREKLGYE